MASMETIAAIPAIRENAARQAARLLASGHVSPEAASKHPMPRLEPLPDMPEWRLVAEHDIRAIAQALGHVVSSSGVPNDDRILSCTGRTMYSQLRMLSSKFWERPWNEKRVLLACGFLPQLQPKDKPLAIDPDFICDMLAPSPGNAVPLSYPYAAYLEKRFSETEVVLIRGYPYATLHDHMREFDRIADKVPGEDADRIRSTFEAAFDPNPSWYDKFVTLTPAELAKACWYNPFNRMLSTICDGLDPDTTTIRFRNGYDATVFYEDDGTPVVARIGPNISDGSGTYRLIRSSNEWGHPQYTLSNAYCKLDDGTYNAIPLKGALEKAMHMGKRTGEMERNLASIVKSATDNWAIYRIYMEKLHYEEDDDATFGFTVTNPDGVHAPLPWHTGIQPASDDWPSRQLPTEPPSSIRPIEGIPGHVEVRASACVHCPQASHVTAEQVMAIQLVQPYPDDGMSLHVFAPYSDARAMLRMGAHRGLDVLLDMFEISQGTNRDDGHLVFSGDADDSDAFESLIFSIAQDPTGHVLFV